MQCREKAEVRREERRRKRDAEEAAVKAAKDRDRKEQDGKEKDARSSGEMLCLNSDLPLINEPLSMDGGIMHIAKM